MRKIKRHNSQACNFRIKFNLDKNRLCFNLVKSKNLVHNHKPEIIENEVRFIFNYNFQCFSKLYRNIKIPFQIFIEISNAILNNEICLKTFPYDLSNKTIQKIEQKFPNEIHIHIKEYGNNFLKKLKQLIKMINLLNNEIINSAYDNIIFENKIILLYKIFLKKSSSSYLRLEHCQELYDLIN